MRDSETVERIVAILEGERLCVRCRSYRPGADGFRSDTCEHPRAFFENSDGDNGVRTLTTITGQYSCFAMRSGICGKKAMLFEPKE